MMRRKQVDLTKELIKYVECWVALSSDETHVVASGKHPKDALKKAHVKGERAPILMWAPREHGAYIV